MRPLCYFSCREDGEEMDMIRSSLCQTGMDAGFVISSEMDFRVYMRGECIIDGVGYGI